MTDSSRNAEDYLYGDDANFGTEAGTYDPYRESGSQWLYNDTQPVQVPQSDSNTAKSNIGVDTNASNVGPNRGVPATGSVSNDEG
ncbi:hypothetical protein IWW38_004773, partial [Coemansia aciculifera]